MQNMFVDCCAWNSMWYWGLLVSSRRDHREKITLHNLSKLLFFQTRSNKKLFSSNNNCQKCKSRKQVSVGHFFAKSRFRRRRFLFKILFCPALRLNRKQRSRVDYLSSIVDFNCVIKMHKARKKSSLRSLYLSDEKTESAHKFDVQSPASNRTWKSFCRWF